MIKLQHLLVFFTYIFLHLKQYSPPPQKIVWQITKSQEYLDGNFNLASDMHVIPWHDRFVGVFTTLLVRNCNINQTFWQVMHQKKGVVFEFGQVEILMNVGWRSRVINQLQTGQLFL